ncbi:MAG: phenylalanine--tRNA ligase subunit alpha [Bacillota bacterium]
MSDVLVEVDQLAAQAAADLSVVKDADALEQFRIKYLGSNGSVKRLMEKLRAAPKEQKAALGQRINAVKKEVTEGYEAKKGEIGKQAASGRDAIDVTEPGKRPEVGNRHILTKVADELTELFGRMGFAIATGPEVEDEFHNFIALNIPKEHPARDPLDNFYLTTATTDGGAKPVDFTREGGQLLLRTQTSTGQIRVMERQRPPIRVVIPGRVYRPDTVDATHLFMFHQLEALVVDKNVTMVDLKSTILQFIRAYFGADTKARFRPSFFPFTEPSAEVDVWFEDRKRWVELGGCGMVHPNVLKAGNIDPEVYSGWAFGFGIERIAMRKYGITDIRSFIENDVRFLRQF